MNIIGLVCEYNPLHNGHIYQINKIKELYPESIIIAIVNGYFLQRGEISYVSKKDKVFSALNEKIDIVLELPVVFGTQSSDIFAYESIKILNEFKIDTLVFGSESNDLNILNNIVDVQEDGSYDDKVKSYLDEGLNYPTALAKALNLEFEFKPNDLLGISYIKAIRKINPNIKIRPIKRTSEYHDLESNSNIISASNIRNKFDNNNDVKEYTPYYSCLVKPIYNNYYKLLSSKIITSYDLKEYLDVSEGLDYRLKKVIMNCNNLEELINNVKSKRYTYNRINRMFVHILLGIKKDYESNNYLRVLGFNSIGKKYLSSLELDYNSYKNTKIYEYELKSSYIYDLINNTKTYEYEKLNKPIVKE